MVACGPMWSHVVCTSRSVFTLSPSASPALEAALRKGPSSPRVNVCTCPHMSTQSENSSRSDQEKARQTESRGKMGKTKKRIERNHRYSYNFIDIYIFLYNELNKVF